MVLNGFGNQEKVQIFQMEFRLGPSRPWKVLEFHSSFEKKNLIKSWKLCMTPVNPRSQVGYRCENRPGTWGVEGARAEVSNTPQSLGQCVSSLSWHIYFLVVWKKFQKFWKRVWKRFGILMLPKSENHVGRNAQGQRPHQNQSKNPQNVFFLTSILKNSFIRLTALQQMFWHR